MTIFILIYKCFIKSTTLKMNILLKCFRIMVRPSVNTELRDQITNGCHMYLRNRCHLAWGDLSTKIPTVHRKWGNSEAWMQQCYLKIENC